MALPEARVLIPAVRRSVKEEGGKPLSTQEQIQWRLLNREKEVVNVIPLVKLAVVWRKAVEHSVYAICIAWRMLPLNSEGFEGNDKIGHAFSACIPSSGAEVTQLRHSPKPVVCNKVKTLDRRVGNICGVNTAGSSEERKRKLGENLYYVSLLEIFIMLVSLKSLVYDTCCAQAQ